MHFSMELEREVPMKQFVHSSSARGARDPSGCITTAWMQRMLRGGEGVERGVTKLSPTG